jgi:hypothetical protein
MFSQLRRSLQCAFGLRFDFIGTTFSAVLA